MTISNDLIYEILLRLPVKHLLRCRCVSKTWCSLVDSPEFIKTKTSMQCNNGGLIFSEPGKLYLADYESLHHDVSNPIEIADPVIMSLLSGAKLVGSAHGLVCFYVERAKDVVIMNPSTRKCITLPAEPYELSRGFHRYGFELLKGGFGYDHVSDDYKFVKFGMCHKPNYADNIIVKVYSVKTGSWTHVNNARFPRPISLVDKWGKFAGGALYWMAIDSVGKNRRIIVGFDLGLGQFREVAWNNRSNGLRLYDCGGNLYTLHFHRSGVDVFRMNDYSAENPWSKAFSMHENVYRDYPVNPLTYIESLGEVLILVDYERLVWYHHESERVKEVRFSKIPPTAILPFYAAFFTESLFQFPKDKQQKQKQNLLQREEATQVTNSTRNKGAVEAGSKLKALFYL